MVTFLCLFFNIFYTFSNPIFPIIIKVGGDNMDELKITRKTEPVMFTIRVDKSIVDFYDDLARKTNRSRNELIGLALEYAKDKIKVES